MCLTKEMDTAAGYPMCHARRCSMFGCGKTHPNLISLLKGPEPLPLRRHDFGFSNANYPVVSLVDVRARYVSSALTSVFLAIRSMSCTVSASAKR